MPYHRYGQIIKKICIKSFFFYTDYLIVIFLHSFRVIINSNGFVTIGSISFYKGRNTAKQVPFPFSDVTFI